MERCQRRLIKESELSAMPNPAAVRLLSPFVNGGYVGSSTEAFLALRVSEVSEKA